MRRLLCAELLKLRTTRMIYALFGTTVVLVGLSVSASVLSAGRAQGTFGLDTPEGVRNVFGSGWPAATIVLVLGILAVSGELRHRTMTTTLLVTPERSRVLAAKLVSYAIVGLVFGVMASIITLVLALPWLATKGIDVSVFDGDVVTVLLRSVVATVLYGLLGVGIGALARHQTAALAIALVWSFALEGMLVALVPEVGRWLPGGAASALSGSATTAGDLLPAWGGGLLLTGYVVALAGLGGRVLLRRDIA